MDVRRKSIVLNPNRARVLFRPFDVGNEQRATRITARVMELSDSEVEELLPHVMAEFHGRHQRLESYFLARFEAVRQCLLTDRPVSRSRRLLIGSYFTQEYALESAALFNPSMVWHPDHGQAPRGRKRFILSLRATGEGHMSSLCFRSGLIDAEGNITIDEPSPFVTPSEVVPHVKYEKPLFRQKLIELGIKDGFPDQVLRGLGEGFTLAELEQTVLKVLQRNRERHHEWEPLAKSMIGLAKANYQIQCDPQSDISERVIFPYSPTEMNGIEDARFVQFSDEDETTRYYATYTAFDGDVAFPQMVETEDFLRFSMTTLNGPEVRNKGMALFPRKIDGYYAMLSRQDGENLYLMYSDMVHFWYTKRLLLRPSYPWEFIQVGNCGSPIETDAGWLVLTHGVGPMRKYSIGAILLDREQPARVIGRLREPLLTPNENEREGYVPNVVYSCGGLVHGRLLVIPYAMSDYASTFATVLLQDVLDAMI
jgi:predicted GH43/DUF377 family glycosyl hydrolase